MDSKFGHGSSHQHKYLYIKHWDEEDGAWGKPLLPSEKKEDEVIPDEFVKEVEDYYSLLLENYNAIVEWEQYFGINRYFKWRVFYATQMINFLNQEDNG